MTVGADIETAGINTRPCTVAVPAQELPATVPCTVYTAVDVGVSVKDWPVEIALPLADHVYPEAPDALR